LEADVEKNGAKKINFNVGKKKETKKKKTSAKLYSLSLEPVRKKQNK